MDPAQDIVVIFTSALSNQNVKSICEKLQVLFRFYHFCHERPLYEEYNNYRSEDKIKTEITWKG